MVRKLTTDDKIGSNYREKYNETVDEIPISFTDLGNGTGRLNLNGGGYITVNFGQSFLNAGSFDPTSIMRVQGNQSCNAGEQKILFSSPLPNANYSLTITDKENLGIVFVSQEADGFTINPFAAGHFAYNATLNI